MGVLLVTFHKMFFLLFFLNTDFAIASDLALDPHITSIENWITSSLEGVDGNDIQEGMTKAAIRMDLKASDGAWADPLLEQIQDKLIPQITLPEVREFIHQTARNVNENGYLRDVFLEADNTDLSKFFQKAQIQKHLVPDTIFFAIFLDNITRATHDNFSLLEKVFDIWERKTSSFEIIQNKGVPFYLKYLAIKEPLKRSIKQRKKESIDPDIGRFLLPLNVNIVATYDYLFGSRDNARAGFILAKALPGGNENPVTGSGPAKLSQDKQVIYCYLPYAKEYCDVYTSWDLGFIWTFGSLPSVAKLIIPAISEYYQAPHEYMNNRTFSLMATFIHSVNSNYESWADDGLTNLFGRVNLKSAQKYASLGV
jgi:hypothetical protein